MQDKETIFKQLLNVTRNELKEKHSIEEIGSYNFLLVKDKIESTGLYSLLNEHLPLTGLLHVHSASILPGETIVETALEMKSHMLYLDSDTWSLSLTKSEKHSLRMDEYLKAHCEKEEEKKSLVKKIADSVRLTNEQCCQENLTQKSSHKAWELFDAYFMNIMFMYNAEVFKKCMELSLHHYLEEKQMSVVELRHPLGWLYNEDGSPMSPEEETAMLHSVVKQFSLSHPHSSVKLIVCALRMIDITAIQSQMDMAFQMRVKYPDFVAGFDMVGVEDSCPIEGHLLDLLTVHKASLEKKYSIVMPIYLHCGETVCSHNDNLDLVLSHVKDLKRIGHGVQLLQKPHLLQVLKQNNVCVECCPLSNQLLNYTKNVQLNQGNMLKNADCPFVVCSDDPTMFQSTQVDDFFYAILSWNLSLAQLHTCLANNITYAADLTDQQREIMTARLDTQWAAFLQAM